MTVRVFYNCAMLGRSAPNASVCYYRLVVWDTSAHPDHVICSLFSVGHGTIAFRAPRPTGVTEVTGPALTAAFLSGFIRTLRRLRLTPAGRALAARLGPNADNIFDNIINESSAAARASYGAGNEAYPAWAHWRHRHSWSRMCEPLPPERT